jgi:diacylglycerol kinase (ATP)
MAVFETPVGARPAAAAPPAQRLLVLVNPAAGGVDAPEVEELLLECERRCGSVERVETSAVEGGVGEVQHAMSAAGARGEPPDWIVVAGGDGTAAEAAEGLARARGCWPGGHAAEGGPAILPMPLGSGNTVHRALWGDRTWRETLQAALAGECEARLLDMVCLCGDDEGSMLGVNVGILARIGHLIEARKAEERAASGTITTDDAATGERYAAAIAQAIEEHEPFPARVTVDGSLVHEGPTTLATIGGLGRFLRGNFNFLPHSKLDDELLDVCVFTDFGGQAFFEAAASAMSASHLGQPGVVYAQGRGVEVERTDGEPLMIEHDGNPRPASERASLRVVPRVVPWLITPAESRDGDTGSG